MNTKPDMDHDRRVVQIERCSGLKCAFEVVQKRTDRYIVLSLRSCGHGIEYSVNAHEAAHAAAGLRYDIEGATVVVADEQYLVDP